MSDRVDPFVPRVEVQALERRLREQARAAEAAWALATIRRELTGTLDPA